MPLFQLGITGMRLEHTGAGFVLKTTGDDDADLRFHAFGNADGADSSPLIGFQCAERHRWMPPSAISAVQARSAPLRTLVDHVLPVAFDVLRVETAMHRTVHGFMTRIGILDPYLVDGCVRSFAAFSKVAATGAECAGCQTRLVFLVEINVVEGDPPLLPPPRPLRSSSVSWMMSTMQSVELSGGDEEVAAICAVCLEDLTPGTTIVRMRCGHVYHRACLLRWLRREPCCPLCRSPAVEDDEEPDS